MPLPPITTAKCPCGPIVRVRRHRPEIGAPARDGRCWKCDRYVCWRGHYVVQRWVTDADGCWVALCDDPVCRRTQVAWRTLLDAYSSHLAGATDEFDAYRRRVEFRGRLVSWVASRNDETWQVRLAQDFVIDVIRLGKKPDSPDLLTKRALSVPYHRLREMKRHLGKRTPPSSYVRRDLALWVRDGILQARESVAFELVVPKSLKPFDGPLPAESWATDNVGVRG